MYLQDKQNGESAFLKHSVRCKSSLKIQEKIMFSGLTCRVMFHSTLCFEAKKVGQ